MFSKGVKERFLLYKKLVLILIAIILLLSIGLILTIAFMQNSAGRFYLISVEGIFIYVCVIGIYGLLSETVAKKIESKEQRAHLSKEEYERFLKQAKENDKFAKGE